MFNSNLVCDYFLLTYEYIYQNGISGTYPVGQPKSQCYQHTICQKKKIKI